MKIRSGFVSNSSSSSFVFNSPLSTEEIENALKASIIICNKLGGTNIDCNDCFYITEVDDKLLEDIVEWRQKPEFWQGELFTKESRVIHSVRDNSIPYATQELILNTFSDVKRFHWG